MVGCRESTDDFLMEEGMSDNIICCIYYAEISVFCELGRSFAGEAVLVCLYTLVVCMILSVSLSA